MSDHAELSPSRAHRWIACPGSIREERKYDDVPSAAALDGTHSHHLLETCIRAGLADPAKYIGQTFTTEDGGYEVDEDRARRVKIAIEYIYRRDTELQDAWVFPEERVSPLTLLNRSDMDGTCDVQIHARDVLEIIDYKDGRLHVPVENNPQLELYALGVLSMRKGRELYPKTIRMTVIQPKIAEMGLEPISWVEMPTEELLDRIEFYVKAAAATDDPEAPLVPGEDQCRFCRAKGSCTAMASQVLDMFGVTNALTTTIDIAQELADKSANQMTPDQIRRVIEAAPLMRQLLEAVDQEALRRLERGEKIEGLKVVYGKGSNVWAYPEDVIEEKLVRMGVPKSEIRETKVVSPSKARKLVWERNQKGQKIKMQLTSRQLKTLENEYVTKVAGKHTVVPESDHRTAVVLDAAPMFSAVQETPALPDWLK